MAKKQKRNLQKLIVKKQQLQQVGRINQNKVVSYEAAPTAMMTNNNEVTAVATMTAEPIVNHFNTAGTGRELRKTAISIILIAILLSAAVVVDHRTPYLTHFGDWLYRSLKLQS